MAEQLPVQFEFKANQTFGDFYPASNQEVIAHLQDTVAGIGEPLIYLWGDKGHGKSHLLQACCHQAYQVHVSAFYLDLSDTVLSPELFGGLDSHQLVCLDNIEMLAGKTSLEASFFNFFNRQRDCNNRLILSANCAPQAIAFALADLRTRVNWGLSLKIQALNDEEKIAALEHKARQLGFGFAPGCARFLLTHYDRSLSALWLMLDKLDFASLAAQRKLTIPFLKQILGLPK